jgi:hypothetical protein
MDGEYHYVTCKIEHLITKLVVSELHLTCPREMEEQSTIDMATCCLMHPFLRPLSP